MLIFDELRLVYTHYYIFMAYQLLHTHTHTHLRAHIKWQTK